MTKANLLKYERGWFGKKKYEKWNRSEKIKEWQYADPKILQSMLSWKKLSEEKVSSFLNAFMTNRSQSLLVFLSLLNNKKYTLLQRKYFSTVDVVSFERPYALQTRALASSPLRSQHDL